MGIFCPDCGMENRDTAKKCKNCGFDLGKDKPKEILLDNRYKIMGKLGEGGMGEVYKAEHVKLGDLCAIKKMSDENLTSDDKEKAYNRFMQEARILRKLNHPGLPQVMDFFEENESYTITYSNRQEKKERTLYFLVMSYIEGKTLQKMMKERFDKPFSEGEVLDWFSQILDILEYLHSQKPPIIYRDMKTDNLMLSQDGKIYLIDFGIAKIFQPQTRGTLIGTPGYARHPELVSGSEQTS